MLNYMLFTCTAPFDAEFAAQICSAKFSKASSGDVEENGDPVLTTAQLLSIAQKDPEALIFPDLHLLEKTLNMQK
ncbi:MAG: hypothetical protein D3925_04530 [Candidatus Electrothrix sp. AR5]|nr:hypothetical protein [Candidatus Electrothrix sp. AR5]